MAYADDTVLIAPSWSGLQHLMDIVMQQSVNIDMILNADKSVCMVFPPRDHSKTVLPSFHPLRVGREMLHFVSVFRT